MLEKIIFYLISAGVGFFSGLFWDRVTQKRNKIKNDQNVLLRAIYCLQDLMMPLEADKAERSSFENYNELGRLGLMIKLKENDDLADEIQKFTLENRGKEVRSNKGLRSSITSLKEKIEERFKQKGGQ